MRRVRAFGGLANRLRVVLSWRATFGPLEVVWAPDGEIANSRFEDVFDPLEGVKFLDAADCGFAASDPYPHAPADWQGSYRELRLAGMVGKHLTKILPAGPYVAIHARRTDHVAMARAARAYTEDGDLIAWLQHGPTLPVFLATDNGSTQAALIEAVKGLGRPYHVSMSIPKHERENDSGQRNTSLGHAAVDLFACAGASAFMGSGASSFTTLVDTLRGLGGWWTR